jgi:hypothetical protein
MTAGDVEGVPSLTSMTTFADIVPNGIGLPAVLEIRF